MHALWPRKPVVHLKHFSLAFGFERRSSLSNGKILTSVHYCKSHLISLFLIYGRNYHRGRIWSCKIFEGVCLDLDSMSTPTLANIHVYGCVMDGPGIGKWIKSSTNWVMRLKWGSVDNACGHERSDVRFRRYLMKLRHRTMLFFAR